MGFKSIILREVTMRVNVDGKSWRAELGALQCWEVYNEVITNFKGLFSKIKLYDLMIAWEEMRMYEVKFHRIFFKLTLLMT